MTAFFTLYLLPCTIHPAWAVGLSTSFADVQLDNVPVGVNYSVTAAAGEGLLLRNLGDAPIRVHAQVLLPQPQDLRGGAEPIPDLSWIHITPDFLNISAHGQDRFQITLTIPSKEKYRHKYYQVTVWSRSEPVPDGRMEFNTGLLSRLRFKTK